MIRERNPSKDPQPRSPPCTSLQRCFFQLCNFNGFSSSFKMCLFQTKLFSHSLPTFASLFSQRWRDACRMSFPLLRQITPKMICFLPFFVSQKFSTIQVERPLVPDLRLGTSLRLNIRYQVNTVKTKIAQMVMIIMMNWFNTFFKLSETGWWCYTSQSCFPGTPRPGACHFTYRSTSRLDGRWPWWNTNTNTGHDKNTNTCHDENTNTNIDHGRNRNTKIHCHTLPLGRLDAKGSMMKIWKLNKILNHLKSL